MISADQIYELVKMRGAVIPSDINSQLNVDTMIVGAMLSDLIRSKRVAISHSKIGGSPLYYIPEQKESLERLYEFLKEKDRRTYDKLKTENILEDSEQDPLTQTSLRALKDFAIPFKVNYKGKELIFWKWYLVNDDEVKPRVKEMLLKLFPEVKKEEPVPKVEKEITPEVKKEKLIPKVEEAPKREEIKVTHTPAKVEEVEINTKETQKTIIETKVKNKEEVVIEAQGSETSGAQEQKVPSVKEIVTEIDDPFFLEVKESLTRMNIAIKSVELIKKKSEMDLLLRVPSQIGVLEYYCKAKSKKKSNEGDLASALLEAQYRNLPCIYLSNGDVPKKIEKMLNTKFKGLKVLTM